MFEPCCAQDHYLKYVKTSGKMKGVAEEHERKAEAAYAKGQLMRRNSSEESGGDGSSAADLESGGAAASSQDAASAGPPAQPGLPPVQRNQVMPTPQPTTNPTASAAPTPPQPAAAPTAGNTVYCGNASCRKKFQGPPGYVFVQCPFCMTTNKVMNGM